MKRDTPNLTYDSSVLSVIEYFSKSPHSFALISATSDRIQGAISEASLIRIFLRFQNQQNKPEIIHYRDLFEPVQLAMENESFPDLVRKVMSAVGNRVIVNNSKNAAIGHIQAKDLLPVLGGAYGKEMSSDDTENLVGQLQKQLADLRSDLFLYENFFEKSPFLMHSANHEGRIQMANEMLHRALGYDYGELLGKTIFDIYPEENHSEVRVGLKRILADGYHKPILAQMVTKKKRIVQVELSSRGLKDLNNKYIGTITISRPINMEYHLAMLEEDA